MTKYSYFELEKAATRVLRWGKIKFVLFFWIWFVVGLIGGWYLGDIVRLIKQSSPQPVGFQVDPNAYPLIISIACGTVASTIAIVWMNRKGAKLKLKVQTSLCVSEIEDHLRVARQSHQQRESNAH